MLNTTCKELRTFRKNLEHEIHDLMDLTAKSEYSEAYDLVLMVNKTMVRIPMNADVYEAVNKLVREAEEEYEQLESTSKTPFKHDTLMSSLLAHKWEYYDQLGGNCAAIEKRIDLFGSYYDAKLSRPVSHVYIGVNEEGIGFSIHSIVDDNYTGKSVLLVIDFQPGWAWKFVKAGDNFEIPETYLLELAQDAQTYLDYCDARRNS